MSLIGALQLQSPDCGVLWLQVSDDANVMLNGFGTVVNSLKMRAKPYLPQICGTIKWRLNNKSAKIRQQAADLIARIAIVMKVVPVPSYRMSKFCNSRLPSVAGVRKVYQQQ